MRLKTANISLCVFLCDTSEIERKKVCNDEKLHTKKNTLYAYKIYSLMICTANGWIEMGAELIGFLNLNILNSITVTANMTNCKE